LLYYVKLKEAFLERCVKDGLQPTTYGAKIRQQVLYAFSLSKATYKKIIDSFATG
jgi:hypothetical protein